MASANSPQSDSTPLRIVSKLSDAFDRLEERIRERAYQIFKTRGDEDRDSVADWLEAQLEVLTPVELVLKEQKKNIVVEGNIKEWLNCREKMRNGKWQSLSGRLTRCSQRRAWHIWWKHPNLRLVLK